MQKHTKPSPGKPAESSAKEKLQLENEILRLKLKAECGTNYHQSGNIPPEVEHQFLKNILTFEQTYANAKLVSVFDFLGQPVVKKPEEIDDEHIEAELGKLIEFLAGKNLTIDFGRLTDARLKYAFITGELFRHQVNDLHIPGMFLHFLYEEFYPDHEFDIHKRTVEFLSDWFEQTMGKFSWELAETFIMKDGTELSKEAVLQKVHILFDSYASFQDCHYCINDIRFELQEEGDQGLAHVDGAVKYTAVLENGDTSFFEGKFKLFFTMEHYCWRIFYFVFPGFEW